VRETKTIKERTQSIRKQILDGITTAKKSHLNNNLQKYEQVIEESTKNKETIESNKETDLSLNRSRTLGLKKLEEQEKEMI
jgi:flagellar biosynthesis chaperone FliJ